MNDSMAVPAHIPTAVAERKETFDLSPRSLTEAMQMADLLANSSIVPKEFIGKPGNILVAVQWGSEIGLKPMQSMQSIAVINGKPSLWGDAVLALVLASPHCKDVIETNEGDPTKEEFAAVCVAQRHGRQDVIGRFSVKDAKAASLIGKQGPWTQYRDRMLKMRARSFALRDQFPDVLKGMDIIEAVRDIDPINTGQPNTPAAIGSAARPPIIDTEERKTLVARLQSTMRERGLDALSHEWGNVLSKDQRKLVGPEEITRIKAIEPDAAKGPSKADLLDLLDIATNASEVAKIGGGCAHLAEIDQDEVHTACAAKLEALKGVGNG